MDKLDQILQVVGENQKTLVGFGVHLEKVDKRLGGVEVRLGGMEDRLKGIEVRLGDLDVRFDKLDARVSRLEDNIVEINTRLLTVEQKMVDMAHFDEAIDRTFNKIDEFMIIVNRYESEIAAIRMKYERLEDRVNTLESRAKA